MARMHLGHEIFVGETVGQSFVPQAHGGSPLLYHKAPMSRKLPRPGNISRWLGQSRVVGGTWRKTGYREWCIELSASMAPQSPLGDGKACPRNAATWHFA